MEALGESNHQAPIHRSRPPYRRELGFVVCWVTVRFHRHRRRDTEHSTTTLQEPRRLLQDESHVPEHPSPRTTSSRRDARCWYSLTEHRGP